MRLMSSETTCAMCGEKSQQYFEISTNNFHSKTHLDLYCDWMGWDTSIQECPHCHYCNDRIGIKIGKKEVIESEEYQSILNSDLEEYIKRCMLAAMVHEKANSEEAWHYNLTLAHDFDSPYSSSEDKDKAKKYRIKACNLLLPIAIKNEDSDKLLQCVDLLRRNGEFSEAQKYLNIFTSNLEKRNKKNDVEHYDFIMKVISFERNLIEKEDDKDYLIDDVTGANKVECKDNKEMELNSKTKKKWWFKSKTKEN